MTNLKVGLGGKVLNQKSHLSRTIDEDGSSQLIALPETETKISLLGNLFLSEGGFRFIRITFLLSKS
jgi:hypothetical protein